jgi:Flp pilus assembly protein TadD
VGRSAPTPVPQGDGESLEGAPDQAASAGTGWRGMHRQRSPDAQRAFELGRIELAEGRVRSAVALLRMALQLAPGDAEVAAELGKAMKG